MAGRQKALGMIVSASYRTDIPTFYGEWFLNRLRAGYCRVINPYNRQPYTVSLRRPDVDAFVFWTKNAAPFLPALQAVAKQDYPFVVQYTINGYPRALESRVVDAAYSVKHAEQISKAFGRDAIVWRYDTIIHTSLTPPEYHLARFRELAVALEGVVDEVVVSFAHFYKKTSRNVKLAAEANGFDWSDPSDDEKRELLSSLVALSREHGMQLTLCSQPGFLVPGAREARCVDAERIGRLLGRSMNTPLHGNRPECGCYESRDIGEYDTCPHGCVYCYAVSNPTLAKTRYRAHDPQSEFLFPQDMKAVDDPLPLFRAAPEDP